MWLVVSLMILCVKCGNKFDHYCGKDVVGFVAFWRLSMPCLTVLGAERGAGQSRKNNFAWTRRGCNLDKL